MAKKTKKTSSKTLAGQKRRRRQWLTFVRMCRYGVNNFTRNAWLTIAATAVMTITLFIIFTSVAARNVLVDTVADLRDKVDMSVYLLTDTPDEEVAKVKSEIIELDSVISATSVSPTQARESFVNQNSDNNDTLDAIKEATNKFPWIINVKVVDINDTSELSNYIDNSELVQKYVDPNYAPSYAGARRDTIESIGRTIEFAQRIGIIASAVFVGISMLIIFNTIRMAIFNRREEIQMMKLIGAEPSFIRGPFVVEAIVYGFFAALIASGLGYTMLILVEPALTSYQINITPTLELITFYAGFVLLGMIAIGALIGIISSLLATRRYLKL